jgi:hypothetical protein
MTGRTSTSLTLIAALLLYSTHKSMADDYKAIGLFEAIEKGSIEVKFIPISSAKANVIVKNKSANPVLVNLPKTFGAVQGGGGLGGGGFGGGGQGGGGLGGGGGGFFRIEPDKSKKLSVATVCLEHGKRDPNPRMKYKIVPLEELNASPEVDELCRLLGDQVVAQNVAQAAAWHLANGLSHEALAEKNRRESQFTGNEKYFTASELEIASSVVQHCRTIASSSFAAMYGRVAHLTE